MEAHKTEGGKEGEGKTKNRLSKSEASRKTVDSVVAISILTLNVNGPTTLFNCQVEFKYQIMCCL